MEKYGFENLDINIDNIYGVSGPSRIGRKKNAHSTGSVLGSYWELPGKEVNRAIFF